MRYQTFSDPFFHKRICLLLEGHVDFPDGWSVSESLVTQHLKSEPAYELIPTECNASNSIH